MRLAEVLKRMRSAASQETKKSMARFGIHAKKAYGVRIPELRKIAGQIGKDHSLANQLWSSGVQEARILASMIADPQKVTKIQMEKWAKDFDSWDLCDGCCGNLFDKTPFAYEKAMEWSSRKEEFVKRAGFSLMAYLAVHDKEAPDKKFLAFLAIIKHESRDERNFVKKAVNWALREIGKRNPSLNKKAIKAAEEIKLIDSRSARWIASDALREISGEAVQDRLRKKARKKERR